MTYKEKAKSKFVYPDKLYARCKDNKTLDMSYAPQNMEAVEYIRTDAFIEEACEWLQEEIVNDYGGLIRENLINDFRKYMEGK